MYNFKYVTKKEIRPFRDELEELIHLVQDECRQKHFTFQYRFVGSVSRNMVTCDFKSNIGFDFDVNIGVNDDEENYSSKEIKHILMQTFDKFSHKYKYAPCEDSTRVFTIKVKDRKNSRVLHSCDFAIVNTYGYNKQQYIRFNKNQNSYTWAEQSKGYRNINDKIEFCRHNGLWQDVRELYLYKKNHNTNTDKKSRSIFAETVNEICQVNGYDE